MSTDVHDWFVVSFFYFSYRLFNQKRELEILSIQPVDAGRYRCVASNEAGSLEVSVDLTVGGRWLLIVWIKVIKWDIPKTSHCCLPSSTTKNRSRTPAKWIHSKGGWRVGVALPSNRLSRSTTSLHSQRTRLCFSNGCWTASRGARIFLSSSPHPPQGFSYKTCRCLTGSICRFL